MFFVSAILLLLSLFFIVWGVREESRETLMLGVALLMVGAGTALITFFAFSAIQL